MAFPDDLTMVTVTHPIADAARRPLPGVVVATPTGRQWKQSEGSILPAEYTAPIEDGTWTLELPAVDQFINLEAYRIEERPTEGGKPWARPYHIAPTLEHAPGPVDATDVITTPPRGGDIVFTAGPATDSSMSAVIEDETSATRASLMSTFVAQDDYPGIEVDTSVGTRVMVGGVMMYGDTGWRDVTDDLLNGWVAIALLVRREGDTISLKARGLDGREATDQVLYELTHGFRSGGTQDAEAGLLQYSSNITNAAVWGVRGGSAGRHVRADNSTGRTDLGGTLRFATTQGWPTSLPGDPA